MQELKGREELTTLLEHKGQYGAGVPRLMITMGVEKEIAEAVHTAYWNLNWAVKEVANQQQTIFVDGQTWLYNPVTNLFYSLRSKKDIFSTLVQGTAAYIFDFWLAYVLQEGYENALLGQFHDEFILKVKDTEEEREKIERIIKESVEKVKQKLEFNVDLGCDVQFGKRYSSIH